MLLTPGTTWFELANTGLGALPRHRRAGSTCLLPDRERLHVGRRRYDDRFRHHALLTHVRYELPARRAHCTPERPVRSHQTKSQRHVIAALALVQWRRRFCGDRRPRPPLPNPPTPSTDAEATDIRRRHRSATSDRRRRRHRRRFPADPVMPLTGLPIETRQLAWSVGAGRSRSTTTRTPVPQSGLEPGRHRLRGERRALSTRFAAGVPDHGTGSRRTDPQRTHAGRRAARLKLNQADLCLERREPGVHRRPSTARDFVVANVQTNARSASQSSSIARPLSAAQPVRAGQRVVHDVTGGADTPTAAAVRVPQGRRAVVVGDPSSGVDLKMDGVNVTLEVRHRVRHRTCASRAARRTTTLRSARSTPANVVVLVGRLPAQPGRQEQPGSADDRYRRGLRLHRGDKVRARTWTTDDRLAALRADRRRRQPDRS